MSFRRSCTGKKRAYSVEPTERREARLVIDDSYQAPVALQTDEL